MNVEILPRPLCGAVDAPASKSVAHRMLICAALADQPSTLRLNAASEDITATENCLRQLGAAIETNGETRIITPPAAVPVEAVFDCGESGSTLRFLVPIAASLGIRAVFHGQGRLPQRPMEPLRCALRSHGVDVSDDFPLRLCGRLTPGTFELPGFVSSQFITGLLLALPLCGEKSVLQIQPPLESAPYVDITLRVLSQFGVPVERDGLRFTVKPGVFHGGDYTVEGDWSNAAFWLCAGVRVRGLDQNSAQGDRTILSLLSAFGADIHQNEEELFVSGTDLHSCDIDAADIPDLVPVLAAVAATARGTTRIFNAARLRLKESDRIRSTLQMLHALGATAEETDDGLRIQGVPTLKGGVVDGCGDHRIVMAAAVAAQHCSAPVRILGAHAVNKSYPDFFQQYQALGGMIHVL